MTTNKTLRKGMRGAEVAELQSALHLIADGIFGPITEEAVKTYQRENLLTVDGIAGPQTLQSLKIWQNTTDRRITEIILHCTATPEGEDWSVERIRQVHVKERGFADIGYHYVIALDGTINKGRPTEKIGAHCLGHNAHSIGIAYVGGLAPRTEKDFLHTPKDTRTPQQREALRSLVGELQKIYPKATVHGHYEYSEKPCPCFKIEDL